MTKDYRVIIEPEALAGIESAYEWIQGYSPERASTWLNGLLDAIQSLSTMPLRCPLALENDYFEEEIRQLLYGKRGRVYRILFTIRDSEVHILFVRHSAQAPLSEGEQTPS